MKYLCLILLTNLSFTFLYSQEFNITNINDSVNIQYDSFNDRYYVLYEKKGNWKVFYDEINEILAMTRIFKNDTCVILNYYKTGILKEKVIIEKYYTKNRYQYWIARWCENGQLKYVENLKIKTPRKYDVYYCNGNKERVFYLDDSFLPFGNWTEWYESGKIKFSGNYNNDNKKEGVWKYYKENGELEKVEEYENGKLKVADDKIEE